MILIYLRLEKIPKEKKIRNKIKRSLHMLAITNEDNCKLLFELEKNLELMKSLMKEFFILEQSSESFNFSSKS